MLTRQQENSSSKLIRPEKIIKMGKAKLKENIKTIGLFNTKAENVLKTCRILLDDHSGEVPRTREELESLPEWDAKRQMWS